MQEGYYLFIVVRNNSSSWTKHQKTGGAFYENTLGRNEEHQPSSAYHPHEVNVYLY
ncbi:hypothetical protein PPTG_04958 [Phytophthora nicotianae INRA-310]|uniref:Uncharacterized protein n=2 Tax=Phytophthora nicotianae TaxID=4792 RepID=W2R4U0_PHYN3|nr:hypothetical protein PPTG_04958 [Phytophthora nicotianae INRA-310]ETI31771.1 hypothetical protein F443_21303 [Phytophthora nicotianae P1569]ETN19734.1 hypothetical protein PPTG_04958 [Phytophthora nicotianae INRA-310]